MTCPNKISSYRAAECGGIETRLIFAARAVAYFNSENHTRNIDLLVTFMNLKLVRNLLENETNFRLA